MRRAVLALLVLLAGMAVACTPARAAATCGWQFSTLDQSPNYLQPDTNAAYWAVKFPVTANLTIQVNGTPADARYWSLTAYNSWGVAGAANELHDTQIALNPDGTYTVTVSHASGANKIPFANLFNGTDGYLVYRVYVPAGGNYPAPPTLTIGGTTYLPCTSDTQTGTGVFNNPDNTYIDYTPPSPSGSTVTVVTGLAPTAVRYWSWCTYVASGAAAGCLYDAQTPLDSSGRYHVVLGQPDQQAAIQNAGYTFLPYAGTLMLRNLLGNQTTGAYTPTIKTCQVTDAACVTGATNGTARSGS